MVSRQRDIEWADGLRGIASCLVVIYHVRQTFIGPWNSVFFDFPISRLVTNGGHASVAIFFLLSGFVCSLKPLRLARSGNAEEAKNVVASSAFRRVLRLYMPAALVTTISWFLCQIGAYNLAASFPSSSQLYYNTPQKSPDLFTNLKRLLHSYFETWRYGDTWVTARNEYDPVQWTLAYEIRGSMLVYFMLVVTSTFTSPWRCATFLAVIVYSSYSDDVLCGVHFYTGALIAELSLIIGSNEFRTSVSRSIRPYRGLFGIVKNYWTIILAIFSLFLGSYPDGYEEEAAWSRFLLRLGKLIFPSNWILFRGYSFLCSVLLIFSILFSPTLRRILSCRPLMFLGSISFPIYLLHSTLIKTVLVWLVVLTSEKEVANVADADEKSSMIIAHSLSIFWVIVKFFAYPLWIVVLMYLSTVWRDRVDTSCIIFAKRAEQIMTCKGDFSELINVILIKLRVFRNNREELHENMKI